VLTARRLIGSAAGTPRHSGLGGPSSYQTEAGTARQRMGLMGSERRGKKNGQPIETAARWASISAGG
jgi:hypothetical protein